MTYTYEQLRKNPKLYKECGHMVPLICEQCGTHFNRHKKSVITSLKRCSMTVCSLGCKGANQTANGTTTGVCAQCGVPTSRPNKERKKNKSDRMFCSRSCAITYNNKNKSYGIRRSKMESYIEKELSNLYPNFHFLFNNKETIGSELDIYLPEFQLAFEINGIFHYQPIYGEEKLLQIQANDRNKTKQCQALLIDLHTIDISSEKHFKKSTATAYVTQITKIIEEKRKVRDSNSQAP